MRDRSTMLIGAGLAGAFLLYLASLPFVLEICVRQASDAYLKPPLSTLLAPLAWLDASCPPYHTYVLGTISLLEGPQPAVTY